MTTVLSEDTLSRNLTANVRRITENEKVLYSLSVAGAAVLALAALWIWRDLSLNLQVTILVKQKSLGGPSSLYTRKTEDGVGTYEKINYQLSKS